MFWAEAFFIGGLIQVFFSVIISPSPDYAKGFIGILIAVVSGIVYLFLKFRKK